MAKRTRKTHSTPNRSIASLENEVVPTYYDHDDGTRAAPLGRR